MSAIAGIVGRAAVACRDIEIAVGTEFQRAAVVVGERLRNQEQLDCRRRIRTIGIGYADAIARDDGCAIIAASVIDEEQAVVAKVRMESESKQALFATELNERGQVEKRRRRQLPVLRDADPSGLLDDEQAPSPVTRARDIDRVLQSRNRGHKPRASVCEVDRDA